MEKKTVKDFAKEWKTKSSSIISESARALGTIGGKVKSDKKTASSRLNGKKGGRPRKITL